MLTATANGDAANPCFILRPSSGQCFLLGQQTAVVGEKIISAK
jgi:hypothetical protein